MLLEKNSNEVAGWRAFFYSGYLLPKRHLLPKSKGTPCLQLKVMVMAVVDLNADPEEQNLSYACPRKAPCQALFDLNALPEEYCGRRDIDLNLVPQQGMEEDNPFEGLSLASGPANQKKGKKELPNDQRKQLYEALVWRSTSGRLSRKVAAEVAAAFSVSTRTVWRIWKQARNCLQQGTEIDVCKKRVKCGRKRVQVDLSKMLVIPLSKRTTLDDLSRQLQVSKYKLWKLLKEGQIKRHSNNIKPLLTEDNKKERLRWCISMLDPTITHAEPIFKDFSDIVYIDEKWFYLTKKTGRYYILPQEEEPYRTCKNKNFIPKVMFLCAIARPRMDNNGKCTFDGKIGCFPFVTYEPAKRTSKNRVAGTYEMKPIMSVTKEVMRSYIIEKVIPAIREKWPVEDVGKPIFIQQDNARPHIDPADPLFCEAAKQDGFDMKLICQPPNSPDFNVLDLGFFASIQAIQYKEAPRTLAELVAAVKKAYEEYEPAVSDRIFTSLQLAMTEAMKVRGGNNYKMVHVNKSLLQKEGKLPRQMKCDLNLVYDVCRQINE